MKITSGNDLIIEFFYLKFRQNLAKYKKCLEVDLGP
jgi:hypothetical protein